MKTRHEPPGEKHNTAYISPKVLNQSLIQPQVLAANLQETHLTAQWVQSQQNPDCGDPVSQTTQILQQIHSKKKKGTWQGQGW